MAPLAGHDVRGRRKQRSLKHNSFPPVPETDTGGLTQSSLYPIKMAAEISAAIALCRELYGFFGVGAAVLPGGRVVVAPDGRGIAGLVAGAVGGAVTGDSAL